MKKIEINDVISKAGSKFIILDLFNDLYLCEQLIDGVNASFEVGNLFKNNLTKFGKKELYLTIPPPSKFGLGIYDKSFSCKKDSELKAREYFNECKLLIKNNINKKQPI
jgi:hypothetical protein